MAEGVLVLRRKRDGSLRLDAGREAPAEHTFSSRFMQRHIQSGEASVSVTLHLSDGDVTYDMVGFEPLVDNDGEPVADDSGSPRLNFTGWVCELAGSGKRKGKRNG